MSVRLAIAAVAALAGLSALKSSGRSGSRSLPLPMMGSRSKKHGLQTLWVGTHSGNIEGILAQGLIPRGGESVHRTKSRAVFLTDSVEAALMYASADPQFDPILVKVNVEGLELFPDTDDIGSEIGEYLSIIERETGVEWLEDGMVLTEADADSIEDSIEAMDASEFNISARVDRSGGEPILKIYPAVCVPPDSRALEERPQIYESLEFNGDGEPCVMAGQWQHYGTIDKSRIMAVYKPSPNGELRVESYGRLEVDCKEVKVDDILSGDMKELIKAVRFPRARFGKSQTGSTNGPDLHEIVKRVRTAASALPQLVDRRRCKPKTSNPLECQCYHAAEAVYHLAGGPRSGLVPVYGRLADGTHWWLEDKVTGEVVDPTACQLPEGYAYRGRRAGFLTKEPSKRAKILMQRVTR
jgi:hypothetical protein